MGTSETLRSVIDAGSAAKRLDELSCARVIGKVAQHVHAAQQKAGAGKAVGPITPAAIAFAPSGAVSLELGGRGLGYSAPEQVTGGSGDRRSDVFSLGTVMWEALTHQRLFDAMNDAAIKVAVQERAIGAPVELNANVPAELSAICMRALARNPADRYQSAKAMAVEIEEFLSEAGYEDSDEPVAQYLAKLVKPVAPVESAKVEPAKVEPAKVELPKLTPIASPTSPPPMAQPSATLPLPSLLKKTTTPPETKTTAPGTGVTPTPPQGSPAGAVSPLSFLAKPTTTPPPNASAAGAALASALASAVTKPVPAVAPAPAPTPAAEPATSTIATPVSNPPEMSAPGVAAAVATAESKPVPLVPMPPVLPSTKTTLPDGIAGAATATAAPAIEPKPAPTPSSPLAGAAANGVPDPAAVVSLPAVPGSGAVPQRDSLAAWAWKTDSHEALDESDYEMPQSSRKPLVYMIGGGVGLALVVTLIAVFSGGSPKPAKKAPAPSAAMREGSDEPAAKPAVAAAEPPAPAPAPAPSTDTTAPAPAPAPAPGSAAAPAPAPEPVAEKPAPPAVAEKPAPPPVVASKPAPPPVAEKPAPKPAPAPAPKPAAPVVASKPAPPPPKPPTPAKPPVVAKANPPKPAAVPAKPAADTKDAESAYRAGLQQFARGDTTGALSSLRTALAANPGYAPTWRGLGLVFEKLGEKEQARASFRRYLQLAPSANDADNIKGRLERLGT